jgi:acid phosphatase family membrane protein YuiD
MGWLVDVFTNRLIIVPVIAWLTAQVLKAIINILVTKKFSLSRLVGDGGMPSGHSATVVSLACMCAFVCGFGSVEFAISAILAIIVMHDAMGVRLEAGKQAMSIISIIAVLDEYICEKDKQVKTEKLKVLIGHTPLQVVAGAILGFIVAMVANIIIG